MSRSELFMKAMYAAIADDEISLEDAGAFGNGVDRSGNRYIDEAIVRHPVLTEYMSGRRSTEDSFNRYTCKMRGWDYKSYIQGRIIPA